MLTGSIEPAGAGGQPPNASTGRPPLRRRGRILFSLLAVLVFVGLAPLATVAWKLIDINREALKTSQQELQLLMASSAARDLDSQVEALRFRLSSAARGVGGLLGRPAGADEATIRSALDDIADDRMWYLRFTDIRGSVVDTRSTATVPKDLEPLFVAGLRRAAESVSEGRGGAMAASISEPILLSGTPPRAAAVLSSPVVSTGTFRGVLSALVDLQTIWEAIARGNQTGQVLYAVDARGRVFASAARSGEVANPDFAKSEIVGKFLSQGASRRARETMPFTLRRDGKKERCLGSYESTHEGWGIFVHAKERQIYLPVKAMVENTLLWALGALLFAMVAARVLAGTLSRPIDHLAAAARAFATGDLSHRVQVPSHNEIGELAEAFNRMASQIEDSIRRLNRAADANNELFLGTSRALAEAIDAKDPYTKGHSMRVNRYSVILGRQLGLSREEINNIHIASLLHDVGKIAIDDVILKKPGRLTPDELSVMQTHAARGAKIMSPIRQMREILPGLRNHHERWQGGGYPDGLEGDAIPLTARVIAVADRFDAMTTDRPYQRALSFEDAVRLLNEFKGTELEGRIVEAFNRAYQAGEIRPEEVSPQTVEAAIA